MLLHIAAALALFGQSLPPRQEIVLPKAKPEAQAKKVDTNNLSPKSPAVSEHVVTNQKGPDTTETAPKKEESGAEVRIAIGTERLADYTRALAIGTFVLAAGTLALWYATRTLAVDTRNDAAKALIATNAQVGLMWDSGEAAKRMAARQLRAYVNVGEALWHVRVTASVYSAPRPIFATLAIKNFGQTPASGVRAVAIFHYGPTTRDRAEVEQRITNAPPFILAPGETYVIKTPSKTSPAYEPPGTENVELLVYGEIRYTDAFGRPRWTKFSYIGGESEGPMRPTDYGNEIDQEEEPEGEARPVTAPVVFRD